MEKPVFGVFHQVRHKLGCTTTEDGYRLEISCKGRKRLYYPCSENQGADHLCAFVSTLEMISLPKPYMGMVVKRSYSFQSGMGK